ncbi:bacteriorhodopsin [Aureimonas jatrophae]|jgi:bacteriorhodopsin|uniref:Bacteriorhodopsin n=1 Tax=Aureimonas jatrophae TaxID=1166073 RepID=A0A1H0HX60_9HYPH|nr:bacteriorhodopsin [Aureimonas jatrophae]MBB3950824.1 bacteriorhodopsin [Aureimonas jatrophae]SDO23796.1 Bacteriorhodopsin [Aureimonas jatrophae]
MEKTALLTGFVVMSLGSLALYAKGPKSNAVRHHTQIHSLVPFIAATSYLAMYLGTMVLTRQDGVTLYLPRYADWLFTTPLLLAGLVALALHEHPRQGGYLVAIIGLDALMIVTGLLSAISFDGTVRLVWFLWSCAAFAGVYAILWGPLRQRSASYGGALDEAYRKNTTQLSVVWLAYPVVFALGPEGFGTISSAASVWIILILDVVAKVVYGYVAGERLKAAEPELQRREERRLA